MIGCDAELRIKRQAQLLGVSSGTVYYQPGPVSEAELALMRRIDGLYLEHPFTDSRMLRDFLRLQGIEVGRRHVVAGARPNAAPIWEAGLRGQLFLGDEALVARMQAGHAGVARCC